MKNVVKIALLALALTGSAQCGHKHHDTLAEEPILEDLTTDQLRAKHAAAEAEIVALQTEKETTECEREEKETSLRRDYERQQQELDEKYRQQNQGVLTKLQEIEHQATKLEQEHQFTTACYDAMSQLFVLFLRYNYTPRTADVYYTQAIKDVNAILSKAPEGFVEWMNNPKNFANLLMQAAVWSNAALINAFILAGMDVHYKNDQGFSALSLALDQGHLANAEELLKHGATATWKEKAKILKLRARQKYEHAYDQVYEGYRMMRYGLPTSIAGADASDDY